MKITIEKTDNKSFYCPMCSREYGVYKTTNEEHGVYIYFCESCFDYLQKLEKPKVKVKKWQFLYKRCDERYDDEPKLHISVGRYSCPEDLIKNNPGIIDVVLYKIPESEIEVEQ